MSDINGNRIDKRYRKKGGKWAGRQEGEKYQLTLGGKVGR
jgi:hypothetical protein